jgi:tol-pal system protein YbgF
MHTTTRTVFTAAAIAVLAGCATTGSSSQVDSTVFATYRKVSNIEKTMGESVSQLNQTTADLIARVDESDRQSRVLMGLAEENQVQLRRLEAKLDSLTAALYRHLGLTPPPVGGGNFGGGDISIVPPNSGGFTVTPPSSTAPPVIGVPNASAVPEPQPDLQAIPDETPAQPVISGNPVADYQQAHRSYAATNYEQALSEFEAYIERHPNTQWYPNAVYWKGECLLKLGRNREALAAYQRLMDDHPSSDMVPFAMYEQALCYNRLGQADKAKQQLQLLIEHFPMTVAAEKARSQLQKLQTF